MTIRYMDRKTREIKEELIFGDKYLKWVYESKTGPFLLESFLKRKLFSSFYGWLQDLPLSHRKIEGFITSMHINMLEAKKEDIHSYGTFNDFFTRELKSEARPIEDDPHILVSPADGKILAWENIDADNLIQVKGYSYSLSDLLQDQELACSYDKGICIIVRLCPSDYHRFHFSDSGIPSKPRKINGHYYSVSPIALKKITKLYCENKRELTLFKSDHFDDMVLVEVGATCVGSIIQTYAAESYVKKGAEKGYFKFGGSTTIMLLKKDTVQIDDDILANTSQGLETSILMGERIGCKN